MQVLQDSCIILLIQHSQELLKQKYKPKHTAKKMQTLWMSLSDPLQKPDLNPIDFFFQQGDNIKHGKATLSENFPTTL